MSSEDLYERAQRVIPGGVNSPVRAFGSVGGTPRFIASGSGARITDVDGRAYTDYVCSWGPLIHGHAHPEIVAAARQALERGSSFGAPTEAEVELAEAVVAAVPAAEAVRLVSSGTEAAMSALRLARGATGRDKVVKFAGHYHGHADHLLVEAGSGVATLGIPGSPGVTAGAVADTIVLPWNDIDAVRGAFAEHGDDIAAVICEPAAANMGVVPAAAGFLELLSEVTAGSGTVLVFDEVITGFRVARGGMQERSGITPDLVVLGKVLGGGFPLAAFAGRADLMAELAPGGPVYQAGTLSGNPVAVAAGLAQLRLLTHGAYHHLDALADQLAEGLAGALPGAVVQQEGNLLGLFFADGPVADYAGARAADHTRYATFFNGMLERGQYLAPSGYEALFVSTAHTPADIDATVAAADEVAKRL